MGRLARLERDVGDIKGAVLRISGILVDHGTRIDRVSERVDALGDRVDALGERLTDRLDRLIAATTQERTLGFERLADIERRLIRLEERATDP